VAKLAARLAAIFFHGFIGDLRGDEEREVAQREKPAAVRGLARDATRMELIENCCCRLPVKSR